MPAVERPDGARIHWEPRGEGPLVLICPVVWSYPGVYTRLMDDLSQDHRVVVHDPRGHGGSSREGPYDAETDRADLEAVVDAAGGEAVAIAVGDGFNRAVRVAAQMLDTEPRVAMRTLVTTTNPDLGEAADLIRRLTAPAP